MAMELVKAKRIYAGGKETLYVLGGVAMVALGAGLILSNPTVRRYLSQIGVSNMARAAFPDIARYLRLRAM